LSSPRRLLCLALTLAALSLGCGVSFSRAQDGTEVFKGLEISGDRVVGAPLTLSLQVAQGYPVPVRVACYYEDDARLTDDQRKLAFLERATPIGEVVLPAAPDARPDADLTPQSLSFEFTIAAAGDYVVACLTPAAPENGWSVRLRIAAATGLAPSLGAR
jgi:hypothetical protein